MAAKTVITRGQFFALMDAQCVRRDAAKAFQDRLARIGIEVEHDPITPSDLLSETSLVEMGRASGFYLGPVVSTGEIRQQYPWLSETEVELVAEQAQKTLRNTTHIGDHLDGALQFHSLVTEAFLDVPFLDNEGRTWVMVQARDGDGCELVCSDGLIFRQDEDGAWFQELSLELVELHERVLKSKRRPRVLATAELDLRHG